MFRRLRLISAALYVRRYMAAPYLCCTNCARSIMDRGASNICVTNALQHFHFQFDSVLLIVGRAVFGILWRNFSISLLYMFMSASIWCSRPFYSFAYSDSFPDILPPSLYVDRIFAHISLRTKCETSKFESKFVCHLY